MKIVSDDVRYLSRLLQRIAKLDPSFEGNDAEVVDNAYRARDAAILQAMAVATRLGYRTGFDVDPEMSGFVVAYLEVPTGVDGTEVLFSQLSWHMPRYEPSWDGHTTAQKYKRIDAFLRHAEEVSAS